MKMPSNNYFVFYQDSEYPDDVLFNPESCYPELPFEICVEKPEHKNDVYRMIRELLYKCGYDKEHYGLSEWNPLGGFVVPGNTVLIKPNLVMHTNPAEADLKKGFECMITHPSLVRCIFDYVYIALKGKGKIIIADAPVQDCDFNELLDKSGYGKLFEFIKGKGNQNLVIDIADLRDTGLINENGIQRQYSRKDNKYKGIVVDLGGISKFNDVKGKNKFRITNYAASDTVSHHTGTKNEYCVSESLLQADVVINIPKPKTHRIAGYTAALKNMIGINTRKEYLPHHRKGSRQTQGDEYIGTHKFLKGFNSSVNDMKNWALKKNYDFLVDLFNKMGRKSGMKLDSLENDRKKFGMWYGNDTIWRTILDVNKIVYYCDKEGIMHDEQQRKVLHFGDMIVSGEKEGPLRPSYKKVGGILFSDNPVAFDCCATRLMGFEYGKFPVLVNALKDSGFIGEDISEIRLCSNNFAFDKNVLDIVDSFKFIPTSGWKEHLWKES